jgi:spore coat polysaccharide biosynthesis protein SpsF (cytidylyltransferase family)
LGITGDRIAPTPKGGHDGEAHKEGRQGRHEEGLLSRAPGSQGPGLPVLCIIQARYHSTRMPAKMLCTLDDPVHGTETLIARAWRLAGEAFGADNCVVAIPVADREGSLGEELSRIGATICAVYGPENDVLGRFHCCAHQYRWHPDSVIVRWTPDDPFKDPAMCRRVASGERLPVELGAEAFTLGMLDRAHANAPEWGHDKPLTQKYREHIGQHPALFPAPPPPCPPGVWTIDTPADLEAARAILRPPLGMTVEGLGVRIVQRRKGGAA